MANPYASRIYLPKLCSTVYDLNKSSTKKLSIGLECLVHRNGTFYYEPCINLLGNDQFGVQFILTSWKEFKQIFADIYSYFTDRDETLRDSKVYGTEWNLRYMGKAIELEDERRPQSSEAVMKRSRRSVVIKKVTFERLEEISKCVDKYLEYLHLIKDSVKFLFQIISDFVYNICKSKYNAQIQNISKSQVKSITDYISETDCDNMKKEFVKCIQDKRENQKIRILYDDEFDIVFYEIIFLHTDKIADFINVKLLE